LCHGDNENQPISELLSIFKKSIRRDVSTESRNARSDVHILRRNKNKTAGDGAQRGALLIAEQWERAVPHLECTIASLTQTDRR